jgi:hypothetical protein
MADKVSYNVLDSPYSNKAINIRAYNSLKILQGRGLVNERNSVILEMIFGCAREM